VGSRAFELDALTFLGRDHLELGAIPQSAEAGRAAVDLAASMLHPGARFRSGTGRVLVRLLRGEHDDALRTASECFTRDAVRNLSGRGTLRAQRVVIHTMRGDYDAVLADIAEEAREARVWPLSRYWKAHVCLALGRVEFAQRELDLAARDDFAGLVRDHTLLASVALLADLCLAFEDRARAEQLYRIAAPFSGMIAAPYLATVCTCAADRGLGVLAHALGRHAQAETHFERALELERKLASAPLVAETSARYARMLLARALPGDEERARKLLAQSAEIARRLGIVLWRPAPAAVHERTAAAPALTESGA
ncbi:MAG TPA: tetratricopeptide repeat protein, partial [Polyangiales bacterium]|nr:tetratricopeptide repeat protein [Polyangiales bacterium]